MGLAIPIETSARHIHLCQKDFEILFGKGKELTFKAELSQPGQYVCEERLNIRGSKGTFENVAVLGPFRKETQVEISLTDCRKLGIESVIRQSGDTEGTPGCTLIGPEAELDIDHGVIVAKRHIHMTPVQAIQHPSFALAMHVDTDEANAFAGMDRPTGVILKLFNGQTYSLQKWADELQNGINRL